MRISCKHDLLLKEKIKCMILCFSNCNILSVLKIDAHHLWSSTGLQAYITDDNGDMLKSMVDLIIFISQLFQQFCLLKVI